MKHKLFTITYWHSNLIEEMLFSTEEDAEKFDNALTEYINTPAAIEEFKSQRYPSIYAVQYAINNGTFVENWQGEYTDKLMEACENMVDGYNGYDSAGDCYTLPLNYIFNKVYGKI